MDPSPSKSKRPALFLTPVGTPLATPYRSQRTSAAPTPSISMTYLPFRTAFSSRPSPLYSVSGLNSISGYTGYRIRRVLASRLIWVLICCFGVLFWWSHGGGPELDIGKSGTGFLHERVFKQDLKDNLLFFPANNPKIHVSTWDNKMMGITIDVI